MPFRPRVLVILLVAVLPHASAQTADAHQEGIAAGRIANGTAPGLVSSQSASSVVPGYGQSASQSQIYGQSLDGRAAQRLQDCQQTRNDPTCEATLGALRSAAGRTPISANDATVVGAQRIAAAPFSVLDSVTSNYSACKVQSRVTSPAVYTTQSCHSYLLRELDQSCVKSLTVTFDYRCDAGLDGPTVTAGGTKTCRDPKSGIVTTALTTAKDSWSVDCSALESRVPPGLLGADGDNSTPQARSVSDMLNKCERKASVCLDAHSSKLIDGQSVTRACWQYQAVFDCISANPVSDCGQMDTSGCDQPGQSICTDEDTLVSLPVCTASRADFRCLVRPEVRENVADCSGQQFCTNGSCWDTSHPADADFAQTVSMLEAKRQAGKYFDPATARVFGGADNRCVKKLFGLINCCSRSGSSIGALFNNFSIMTALSAASSVAGFAKNAVGSTYTYDALFSRDAPAFVMKGFESLFGMGNSSLFASALAGDISVTQLLSSVAPGPWSVAVLAIQFSGLVSCPDAQKATALKRDSSLCVTVGNYCSKRLPVIRSCIEQTTTFCCYNSKLARIINVAGRQQLGLTFGSAESPQCNGFSLEEFQRLDFSTIDLSEFYADITPAPVDQQAVQARVQSSLDNCYYGTGQCRP